MRCGAKWTLTLPKPECSEDTPAGSEARLRVQANRGQPHDPTGRRMSGKGIAR